MLDPELRALSSTALSELGETVLKIEQADLDAFLSEIAGAGRIVLHGVGREGLMMKAFAMRLFHLGLDAHVLGDMTTPPLGDGDLLIVSAGPGWFSSVEALARTA